MEKEFAGIGRCPDPAADAERVRQTDRDLNDGHPGSGGAGSICRRAASRRAGSGEGRNRLVARPRRCHGRFCRRYAHPPAGTCAERTRLHV